MRAEILSIGTELLMGQITNTDAQYISGKLPEIGVSVYYHTVVGDNQYRMEEALVRALNRSDLVILTGGLGPTKDDLTKEVTAKVMGLKLVIDDKTLENIKSYFSKMNSGMSANNEKQAYLPEGCFVVRNNNGTAPGCIIEKDGKIVVLLPGPPRELKPMFDETVVPYLAAKTKDRLISKFIKIAGLGESYLETQIMDLIENQTNPTIAPYAREGEVTLRITAKCSSKEEGEILIQPVLETIRDRLGIHIYSENNEEMEQVVGNLLIDKNISLATAESCTGGLLSAKLTDIPGISKVFPGGIVSYSNEMKKDLLGVTEDVLKQYGAVSSQCAKQMAQGIRNKCGTDIGISTTGIAGPGGGSEKKPVGLVYIGLAHNDGTDSIELRLWGGRNKIRNITSLNALDLVRRHILKYY